MIKEKYLSSILDGNLIDKKSYLVGTYKGFNITIDIVLQNNIRCLLAKIYGYNDNADIINQLNEVAAQVARENNKFLSAEVIGKTVVCRLAQPNLEKQYPDLINNCLKPIISFMANNDYQSGCGSCGKEDGCHLYNIQNIHYYLCDECACQIENQFIARHNNLSNEKGNAAMGIVGALLGSIIGGVLQALIFKLGYISALTGFITVVLAFKGYELFGKKLDVKGIVFCILISLVVMYGFNYLAWAWDAYDALKGPGWTFVECFQNLYFIIEQSDITGQYVMGLLELLLFAAFGSVGLIISTIKNSTGSYVFKKEE